jgi:hypothetical protein
MTAPSRRSHRALASLVGAFVGLAAGATPVLADVISDEEAVCRDKSEGSLCRALGKAGRCTKSTCSRNDYSDGVPPKTVQSECVVCLSRDERADEPQANTVEPTKTAGDSKNTEVPTTKGCGNARIGEPSTALGSSVLGIVLLGLALRRRRTRRDP